MTPRFMEYLGTIELKDFAIALLAVIAILQGLAVSHGDSTLSDGSMTKFLPMAQYVFLAIAALCLVGEMKANELLAALVLYWLVTVVDAYGGVKVTGVLFLLSLSIFSCMKRSLQRRTYRIYRWWLVLMAAAGIACYAAFKSGVIQPQRVVNYYFNADKGLVYADYGISYLFGSLGSNTWRLCGLFNEPGYFGTIVALTLCAERMDFRKPSNIVLLIAGSLTFSAAFYIMVILGMILNLSTSMKNTVALIMSFIVLSVALSHIASESLEMRTILTRLGLFEGDTELGARTSSIVDYYVSIMGYDGRALFGYGGGFSSSVSSYNAGIKVSYVDYGLVGSMLMYGFLVGIAAYRAKGNRSAMALVFLFALSLYQRCNVFTMPYFIILFGGMENLLKQESRRDKSLIRNDESVKSDKLRVLRN